MGSSLGPVLANIIMAELERKVITPLLEDGTLKFYIRFVDDTLVLVKPCDIEKVKTKLNSFHKSLNFTVDTFEDDVVHFLDIKIINNQTDVYYKDTNTGQYNHFSSYVPWQYKVSWVRALLNRSEKICSTAGLYKNQKEKILNFMSWNGYPKFVRDGILRRLTGHRTRVNTDDEDLEEIEIFIRPPYAGIKGEQLVKTLIRKMKRFLKRNVKFSVTYETKKLSYFCNNKDKIHDHQKHNIVYEIICPGCGEHYIGKTDCCLATRFTEHATQKDQPMFKHFKSCDHFKDLYGILHVGLEDIDFDEPSKEFRLSSVFENSEIIGHNGNWSQLLFLESLRIKRLNPVINTGVRASRELVIFG